MNRAILTLPMMPVDGVNYGKYITPIVCEIISNVLACNYYHCINLLDSFDNRKDKLNTYLKSLNENHIHYNSIWYDNENIEELLYNIKHLIEEGYVFETQSNIYKCECGIVEIEENKISTCNPNNRKFSIKDGKMICNYCHNECKKINANILAFSPKGIKLEDILVLPKYLTKDVKTYQSTILGSYTTLSRLRDTGIYLNYNNKKYNIDIDFLWATYLSTFKEKEKIVVSGNRMLYQLFLVGVLERCLKPTNNTILLGTPYITNIKNILGNEKFIDDEKLRKLFVIFNVRWNNKEIAYDDSILNYLNSISSDKLETLYDIINNKFEHNTNLYNDLEYIIKKQLNMQESVKKLKLRRIN